MLMCSCATVLHVANITVKVPDGVYRRARVHAAEQGTSVSALVADFLASLPDRAAEFRRLVTLQESVLDRLEERSAGLITAERPTRAELYGEALDGRGLH